MKINSQSGFTLIELLVVIAIIGLLASIILLSVNITRIRARDVKRKADIAQLQKALELYYAINNSYPCSVPSSCGTVQWDFSTDATNWDALQTGMTSVLARLPHDTSEVAGGNVLLSGNYGYGYFSGDWGGCAAGQWYILIYKLENKDIVSPNGYDCVAPPTGPNYYDYSAIGAGANAITIVGKGR